ncbi:potassium channel family protein [Caldithrix abyssi]|uniref:TrkA-N domain protein n=1 Tax=Caldithrix abyssi DSM 13497 TaxID=880073 RepID=H1XRR6_CALAY|nr:potassium channel protein [Caldithrix abyssi]APF17137.1 voltage-gated potassium channel [Caldithrix abyssi DSM 13497]EHO41276.1 TrkA-N domain protein [Caldithrix abyssi DSM 13497]
MHKDSIYLNFIFVAVSLILLLLLGVVGYSWIEGWSWLDALYQTVITFSTVGFQEVAPLSRNGRMFTILLIFLGLVIIALLSGSITTWFVSSQILAKRKILKMKQKIAALKDHVIICGGGETAKTLIREFQQAKKPFVVIEHKPEIVSELQEFFPNLLIIEGDATKDEFLEEARIETAHGLITTMPVDADNLFIVVSARSLNPNLIIVSRAVDPHTESKLYKAGANYVIVPNVVEGLRMASVLLRPTLVSFLEVMMSNNDLALRLEEVALPESSALVNKPLSDARIPQRTGLIVIALKRAKDSQWIFNPVSSTLLHKNDRLIVLGDEERIKKLHALLKE